MDQWLTHCASTAGGVGSNPGWGTKILHAVCCGQKKKRNVKSEVLLGFSNGIQSNRQSESKSWVRRSKTEICKSYDCSHKIKRCLLLRRQAMKNPDSVLKSRDITLPTKVCTVKAMVFHIHVWMWELDHKEGWEPKNWCYQIVVQEKTPGSPLNCKIKLVNPTGNQPWIFTGRTDAEAEAPILWPHDIKSRLIRKDPDAEKKWRQEEKGTRENKMVGCHQWLNGHEFEETLRDGKGQGSLPCCSPWGRKESDTT